VLRALAAVAKEVASVPLRIKVPSAVSEPTRPVTVKLGQQVLYSGTLTASVNEIVLLKQGYAVDCEMAVAVVDCS